MAFTLNLGNLQVRLTADNSSFAKTMRQTEAILDKTAKKMKKIGKTMTKYVTLPLTIMGAASVKAFSDFDDAMTQSLAIMGNVTPQMRKQMEDVAKTLSSKGVKAADELAQSYFFLASAGLDVEQSIGALPVVEKFATAGMFDMALATDLLTDAQTALGLSSKDTATNLKNLNRISDVLVGANVLANTSVQQVAEALTSDAAVAARGFGAELETVVAILDAYGSAGKKAGEAGNLFGRAVRMLTKAQRENGEEFQKLGIEVIDKASGEYKNFIDIIRDMETAFKDMKKPQRDAALETLGFAALAQKAITPLLGLGEAMEGYEERLLNMGGITQEVAQKQLKSFASQMKILWNNAKLVGIEIGLILSPVIQKLGGHLKSVFDWFRGLDISTKKWIVGLATAAAVIGPLLVGLGTFVAFLSFAAGMLPVLITGMGILISLVGTLWAAIAPFVIAAGIFIAIGVAVWAVVDAFTAADLKILSFFKNITIGGEKLGTWMDVLAAHIREMWDHAVNNIAYFWEGLWGGIKEGGRILKRFFLRIGKFISDTFWGITQEVINAVSFMIEKAAGGLSQIRTISQETIDSMLNAATTMKQTVGQTAVENSKVYEDAIQESLDNSLAAATNYYDKVEELDRKYTESTIMWANARKDILTPLQPEEIIAETVENDPAVVAVEQANMQIENLLNDRFVITKDEMDKERALISQRNQAMLSGTGALFGAMAAVAKAGGKKNFKIWKALSMAEAIISTHSAVTKALASPPGPPATIPMAIATATMGFLRVRQIAMTQIGGGGGGGAGGFGGGGGVGITPITRVEEPGIGGEEERLEPRDRVTIIIENVHGSADAEFARQLAQEIYDISGDGVDYGFETTSS